jgi:hypothetical protein
VYLALAGLVVAAYLAASQAGGFLGFPLDDAWIHQTYARNLGERGEFAFVPGQPSAGSTAPLWSALLAAGYALRLPPLAWTFGLGAAALALNAWLAHALARRHWPAARWLPWLAGMLVGVEWHLAWSAVSGMETLVFAALVLGVLAADAERPAGGLGALAGLAVLVRPDGVLLLPVVAARAWLGNDGRRQAGLARAAVVALVFGFVVAGYLAFNQALSGRPWPTTLYAKQAEYAVLRQAPLLSRLAAVGLQPLVGVGALLAPGLVGVALGRARSARPAEAWLALAWVAAMVAAYALRLPVTYQHGRYVMPVIPVVVVMGAGGLSAWLRTGAPALWARVVSRAWIGAAGVAALAFAGIGAAAYARDVQIIETEMVAAARWIGANTEPGALVAAHDIGAVGYFADRALVDLAGLVSPEVLPFIRDEARLAAWLDAAGADYLMTFPGWYATLAGPPRAERVFTTGAPYSPAAGGENMAVYRWVGGPGPAGGLGE